MASVAQRVLVVGGGFSGMSAAIELRKRGVEVDLVEVDPHWRNYGAGISLGGATLRAFRQLGILDEFLAQGSATDNVEIRLPHGPVVATLPTPRIAGPDVPGGGAIMRPVLARILADATRAAGVNVRLGTHLHGDRSTARRRRGQLHRRQRSRYDLVIGADGLHSKVRQTVFPEAPKPRYTGQAVWRAVLPRSPDIKTVTMWPGPTIKPGVNPVSKTEMYVFITEPRPASGEHIAPEELAPRMRALLDGFPDPVLQQRAGAARGRVADRLPADRQSARAAAMVPRPRRAHRRHRPRHDAAPGGRAPVSASRMRWCWPRKLERASDVEGALVAFQDRRWDRCRMVVENSARLGEIEIGGGDKERARADHAREPDGLSPRRSEEDTHEPRNLHRPVDLSSRTTCCPTRRRWRRRSPTRSTRTRCPSSWR